jgi:hypothetical protein
MKNYTNEIILKNNITNWVKLNTDMMHYGIFAEVIKSTSESINWKLVNKNGKTKDITLPFTRAYVWQFRDFFLNSWVEANAEELAKLGFSIYCSKECGSFLVVSATVNPDKLWEKVRTMIEESEVE